MSAWHLNELVPPDGTVQTSGSHKGRKIYEVAETGVRFMEPKRINYQERPIAFLDIEASSIDPRWNDILEIAIIRTDRSEPYVQRFPLLNPQYASQEALDIIGYNESEWADAVPWGLAAQQVWDMLAVGSPAICGHNIYRYDWPLLEWRLRAMGFPTHLIGRPFIDTMSLAFARFHGKPDGPEKSLGMPALCVQFGIPPEEKHRALGGAQRCQKIYERLA